MIEMKFWGTSVVNKMNSKLKQSDILFNSVLLIIPKENGIEALTVAHEWFIDGKYSLKR